MSDKAEETLIDIIRKEPERLRKIREKADTLIQLEKERAAINQKMSAARAEVAELGVSRLAFKAALSRYKLAQTDREELEVDYAVACEALEVSHDANTLTEVHKIGHGTAEEKAA